MTASRINAAHAVTDIIKIFCFFLSNALPFSRGCCCLLFNAYHQLQFCVLHTDEFIGFGDVRFGIDLVGFIPRDDERIFVFPILKRLKQFNRRQILPGRDAQRTVRVLPVFIQKDEHQIAVIGIRIAQPERNRVIPLIDDHGLVRGKKAKRPCIAARAGFARQRQLLGGFYLNLPRVYG